MIARTAPSASSGPNIELESMPLNCRDRIACRSSRTPARAQTRHAEQNRGDGDRAAIACRSRARSQPMPARAAKASAVKVKSFAGKRNWRKPGQERGQQPVDAAVAVSEEAVLADGGGVVLVERAQVCRGILDGAVECDTCGEHAGDPDRAGVLAESAQAC